MNAEPATPSVSNNTSKWLDPVRHQEAQRGSVFHAVLRMWSPQPGQDTIWLTTGDHFRLQHAEEQQHLARELSAERARLRAVIDYMPAGVLIADADGGTPLGNHRMQEIFGGAVPGTLKEYALFTDP